MNALAWNVGDRLPAYNVPDITPDELIAVMEVMHDTNPIHSDPVLAAELGFRGLVNQGPANLAYVAQMLRLAMPGGRIIDIRFRFRDNVVPGDLLRAEAVVTAATTERLTCDFQLVERVPAPESTPSSLPVKITGTAIVEVPNHAH
jgi:3-hydroxybutyryl-CoA dehydratase